MAREKGMGNLQREKSGRWTMRVSIKGKHYSRSTGTTDREKAERYLQRFLAPFGLGEHKLPLSDVWLEYVKSPNRNDLAQSTLNSKRLVWHHFAKWMEHNHLEAGSLAEITPEAIAEYLACLRAELAATTYNNRVCVLREIFHVLANKAGLTEDPWDGVRLRANDSHSRRELTRDELQRLLKAAEKVEVEGGCGEWKTLFLVGIYTGLRLGDCCCLDWHDVDLDHGIIQLVPRKTRKHAHGRPVTIPIHPILKDALTLAKQSPAVSRYVLPTLANFYLNDHWRINAELKKIFAAAAITMSVRIEGRRNRTPEASFHSLRHSFVSFAANAGVPLAIVQSIVGHCSTAMTRHYYHENLSELKRAVQALPSF